MRALYALKLRSVKAFCIPVVEMRATGDVELSQIEPPTALNVGLLSPNTSSKYGQQKSIEKKRLGCCGQAIIGATVIVLILVGAGCAIYFTGAWTLLFPSPPGI